MGAEGGVPVNISINLQADVGVPEEQRLDEAALFVVSSETDAKQLDELLQSLLNNPSASFRYTVDDFPLTRSLGSFVAERVIGTEREMVIKYHLRDKDPVMTREERFPDWIRTLYSLPQGRLVIGCYDNLVRVRSADGLNTAIGKGHRGVVNSTTFNGNSNTLVTGAADNTIRFWDVTSTTEDRPFIETESSVQCLLNYNDRHLFVGEWNGKLSSYSFDIPTRSKKRKHAQHQVIQCAQVHSDCLSMLVKLPSGMLVTGGYDRSVVISDPGSFSRVSALRMPLGVNCGTNLGDSVILGHPSGAISLVDFRSTRPVTFNATRRSAWISSISGGPDGHRLAVTDHSGALAIYDVRQWASPTWATQLTGKLLSSTWHQDTIHVGGEECIVRDYCI